MDAKSTHKILTAARRQQAEFNLDDNFGPTLTQPKKTYNPFDPASKLKKQLGKPPDRKKRQQFCIKFDL